MKQILVTGGAGFIGSNFIKYMLKKYPDYHIINVDALTYAGNLENLKEIEHHPAYHFMKADIRDRQAMERIFTEHSIDTVVNFAAESHVDRSIVNAESFVTTNVLGVQVLLDVAKHHWSERPDDKYCRTYQSGVRFLQISTDEVYGALGATGLFTEQTPLSPNSPYSASKASADLFVLAYAHTFGLPVNITRCSNNYGPNQFPEKLIPLVIHKAMSNEKVPVYGDGLQIRDWLHVHDHCSAIDAVLHKGRVGEVYNIGGNNEKTNIDVVKCILSALDKPENLIQFVKDRPGHDQRYAIDHTKITSELGWRPCLSFENGIRETIQWFREHADWVHRIVIGEYQQYYHDMYGNE